MSVDIIVPEVGESVVDARVSRWLKKTGDQVAAGEALVELETDKIDVEVSAPRAGVLEHIAHDEGADVKIGEVLGRIAPGEAASSEAASDEAAPNEAAPDEAASDEAASDEAATRGSADSDDEPDATPPATPSARRLARERDVALSDVRADGPRVTRGDIERSLDHSEAESKAPAASTGTTESSAPWTFQTPPSGSRRETRERMSKRRATIARRLVEAQQTAAMLTTFNEADMSAVMALRARHKESFKARYGTSLGIASFFVKASVVALREWPRLNAEIQGDEIVLKHYYDIGMAVAASEGLVVPVLRDADRMTFAAIEGGIRGYAQKAKDGSLTLDDLKGGTFSITNGGVFGSLMSTPILNPPQVGILGLHAIKDRPIAVDGELVVRPMMYLALTYDHRIVDGSEAVQFLARVKAFIEDPAALLVES